MMHCMETQGNLTAKSGKGAMEDKSLKLPSLVLVPFLLLAAAAVATGDELATFIVHVQP